MLTCTEITEEKSAELSFWLLGYTWRCLEVIPGSAWELFLEVCVCGVKGPYGRLVMKSEWTVCKENILPTVLYSNLHEFLFKDVLMT